MTVKAKTIYTDELIKNSVKFHLYKTPAQIIKYILLEIFTMCASAYLFSKFVFILEIEEMRFIMVPIISVCAALGIASVPIALWRFIAKVVKMSKHVIGMEITYEFSDSEIIIDSTLPTVIGQAKATYDHFEKVYEKKDVFYFYISKNQLYVLRKSDITDGSLSDLQNILKNNIPAKKYIIKR